MKKLEVTPKILGYLNKVAEGIDPNKVSVYEATALNTLPVKKSGVWNGAKATESYLSEMAAYLDNGGNVPLHQIHDQGYALPVGKTLHAEKLTVNGLPELRILFYVDNEHTKLISGLETSSIDEVSVGSQPKHLLCSECGWDYCGPEATMEHFWECTCENGHTIGKDGVHVTLAGLADWWETSLVSRGAAQKAKIVGRTKTLLGESTYNRLAASGIAPDAKILFASATQAPSENPMDLKEITASFTAQLGAQATLLGTAQATVASQASQITALTVERDAAVTAKTAAETAKLTAETAKATAETALATFTATDSAKALTEAQTTAKEATAALFAHATKLAIAAGGTKPLETATIADLTASMKDSEAKLAALPIGGVGNPAGTGSGTKPVVTSAANFQTRN